MFAGFVDCVVVTSFTLSDHSAPGLQLCDHVFFCVEEDSSELRELWAPSKLAWLGSRHPSQPGHLELGPKLKPKTWVEEPGV